MMKRKHLFLQPGLHFQSMFRFFRTHIVFHPVSVMYQFHHIFFEAFASILFEEYLLPLLLVWFLRLHMLFV